MSGGCGGFGTFFLPKWDEYSLPEVSQILFRIGRPEIEPLADEIRSVGALFRMLLLFL